MPLDERERGPISQTYTTDVYSHYVGLKIINGFKNDNYYTFKQSVTMLFILLASSKRFELTLRF